MDKSMNANRPNTSIKVAKYQSCLTLVMLPANQSDCLLL